MLAHVQSLSDRVGQQWSRLKDLDPAAEDLGPRPRARDERLEVDLVSALPGGEPLVEQAFDGVVACVLPLGGGGHPPLPSLSILRWSRLRARRKCSLAVSRSQLRTSPMSVQVMDS